MFWKDVDVFAGQARFLRTVAFLRDEASLKDDARGIKS